MWSLVTYSKCFDYKLEKEQTIINISAILLLKVRLSSILFITVSFYYECINNDYIHNIIFAEPGFYILEYQHFHYFFPLGPSWCL